MKTIARLIAIVVVALAAIIGFILSFVIAGLTIGLQGGAALMKGAGKQPEKEVTDGQSDATR
jgi:hypothetical protein